MSKSLEMRTVGLYVRNSKHLVSLGIQCEARSGKGDLEGDLGPVTAANCLPT